MPLEKTKTNTNDVVVANDSQTRGFVLAMLITAGLTLFGLELRVFIYRSQPLMIAQAVLAFLFVILLVWQILLIKMRYGITAARPEIVDAVRIRAKELGFKGRLHVHRRRGTWRSHEASVFVDHNGSNLVFDSEAQYLLLDRSDGDQSLHFHTLVDHELAHIVNRDGLWLIVARALLISFIVGLLIKFLLIVAISCLYDPSDVFRILEGITPSKSEIVVSSLSGDTTRNEAPAISRQGAQQIVVTYTVVMFSLFMAFYSIVVRKREYSSDAFAVEHAKVPEGVLSTLLDLLRKRSAQLSRWDRFWRFLSMHPLPERRIACLTSRSIHFAAYTELTVILLIFMLVSFRYTLGNSGLWNDFSVRSEALRMLSGLYVFVFAYCIACIVHPSLWNGAESWSESYRAIKSLAYYSTAAAVFLFAISVRSQPFTNQFTYSEDDRANASVYHQLQNIEFNEMGWLFVSIPVVSAIFACSYLAVQMVGRVFGRCRRVSLISVFFTMCIGFGMTWYVSTVIQKPLDRYRVYQSEMAVRQAHRLSGLTGLMASLEAGLGVLRAEERKYSFRPPVSALLLWEGPFRAGLR